MCVLFYIRGQGKALWQGILSKDLKKVKEPALWMSEGKCFEQREQ